MCELTDLGLKIVALLKDMSIIKKPEKIYS
jgi:hypothetical protein